MTLASIIAWAFGASRRSTKEPTGTIVPMGSEQDGMFNAAYDELRKHADRMIAREAPGQTLQPTALVHEAYARLNGSPARVFKDRRHFMNTCAQVMRNILTDVARRKRSQKHGGELRRIDLDGHDTHGVGIASLAIPAESEFGIERIEELNIALDKLWSENAEYAEAIVLRYFLGMNNEQIAETMGVSVPTVGRHIRFASAWLRTEMGE